MSGYEEKAAYIGKLRNTVDLWRYYTIGRYNYIKCMESEFVGNLKSLWKRFQRYLTHYREKDNYLCLAIIDIDYFKNYNDHYGHLRGDECLSLIGKALAAHWDNSSVFAARIGGEEFALLWLEEDKHNAEYVVEQVHIRLRSLSIPHEKSCVLPYVTVSIGVSIAKCSVFDDTQVIYNFADTALYKAKAKVRNCTVFFNEDEEASTFPIK